MVSLLRISILKKMRAVIVGEAIGVRRKMRRDPVENYSESSHVKFIDEMHEIFGYAKSACRSRDESFPDPRIVPSLTKRVLARPPLVEISNNRDKFCIWRPYCKMGSILSIELGWM